MPMFDAVPTAAHLKNHSFQECAAAQTIAVEWPAQLRARLR
jgi:hypothetical protein